MCTVATYNLYLGADLTVVFDVATEDEFGRRARAVRDQVVATDFPSRAAAIAGLLAREQVDVAGLQEVARWSRVVTAADGSQERVVWIDYLEVLLDALAAEGVEYDVHAVQANFRGGTTVPGEGEMDVLGHNVVLVRRGSGLRVTGEAVGAFSRTLDITTGVPGLTLNVARGWGLVDLECDGRPLRFVNTHLEAWDAKVREAQRDELLDAVAGTSLPLVVAGDFNAEPDAVGMPTSYADAWAVAGSGSGHTCGQAADLRGESALDHRIDYLWVREAGVANCRVVGDRVGDRTTSGLWPSDHAGVVADVTPA
jgi:hypothetical protein